MLDQRRRFGIHARPLGGSKSAVGVCVCVCVRSLGAEMSDELSLKQNANQNEALSTNQQATSGRKGRRPGQEQQKPRNETDVSKPCPEPICNDMQMPRALCTACAARKGSRRCIRVRDLQSPLTIWARGSPAISMSGPKQYTTWLRKLRPMKFAWRRPTPSTVHCASRPTLNPNKLKVQECKECCGLLP